ncbi:HAD family hydrolase [Plantactinospora siamensis]|uniref:HAD family hydrolase n=1 Tax=Plantactinospora siamensis TaxID=555372 RepID=A0ABV6NT00_9ACTN
MARERATALLVDFDGVLRRWDPAAVGEVERRYELPAGVLLETAMRWALLQPAVTGQVTHADWLATVTDALAVATGDPDRAKAAVTEWQLYRGEVDREVLDFVRAVRAAGVRVGLATNATDALDADLTALGLTDEFDEVINSSVLGAAKPSREYFTQACRLVGAAPARTLFVDDSDRAVAGARAAGLSAYRWTGPADLPYLRAALGL